MVGGNHRLAKARREAVRTILARRIRCPQHVSFLTSMAAYEAYVEYWNSKVEAGQTQRINLRRRTCLRSAETAKLPQSDATFFATDCRERSLWVLQSTGSGRPGDVPKPPSSPPVTDRSRMV
jgi:hypothetical protein